MDWVITTAFYSALHFVRHILFPIEVETKNGKAKYNDFETFYRSCNHQRLNKHRFLSDTLEQYHPSISSDYNQLLDIS
ncbi:MAG: hypothetical protein KKD31_10735 [Bacteroidetes bacterium]|nr:hypothetical protein [Bacteroidota bacterium]